MSGEPIPHPPASILIIDDDAQLRQALRRILERVGYVVRDAADGTEGLRSWNRQPADLVITDIMMPGKDGLETIFELVLQKPEAKVIAMTGGAEVRAQLDRLYDAKLFGAIRSIPKPFAPDEMLRYVREMIGPPSEL